MNRAGKHAWIRGVLKALIGLAACAVGGSPVLSAQQVAAGTPSTASAPAAMPTIENLPAMPVTPGLCLTEGCHGEQRSLTHKHGPVIDHECQPCHVPVDGKHTFERMPETKYLCRACHRPYPRQKMRHPDADEYCEACHDPHGGQERFFVIGGSVSGLCLKCHADHIGEAPQHDPVAKGSCLSCHEMHHAEAKPLLRAPRGKICLICHEEKAKGLKESVSVHKPVTEACTHCHAPHGRADRLVRAEILDLCQECHAEMLDRALNAKVPHKAVLEGKHCVGCHDPHFARGRKLLKAPTRDLCLSCHDRTYELADGSVLPNVKIQLTEKSQIHGPARQGSCNPCHNPHGSDYPRLLNYDFPCSFYAPFEESRYELCFRCHDRRMALEPETTMTRFRNGRQNLHYLHVNKKRKGRTCRACHHEHGSNNPLQIRESVMYGKWPMPITFNKRADGGSCATSCHGEHGYDRVNPVKNLTPESQTESPTKPAPEGTPTEPRPSGNADRGERKGDGGENP